VERKDNKAGHRDQWLEPCRLIPLKVNSVSHKWGYRTFETADQSVNCWWLTLPALGEGWHNNHHAFPKSARFGLRWYELDLGFAAIRLLQALHLAWDVVVPVSKIN
jgi:fatty-acid desaturase